MTLVKQPHIAGKMSSLGSEHIVTPPVLCYETNLRKGTRREPMAILYKIDKIAENVEAA
jgi:hypothetical protein